MEDVSNIDLDLLKKNLKLSPTERLEMHQAALDILLEIEKAKDRGVLKVGISQVLRHPAEFLNKVLGACENWFRNFSK